MNFSRSAVGGGKAFLHRTTVHSVARRTRITPGNRLLALQHRRPRKGVPHLATCVGKVGKRRAVAQRAWLRGAERAWDGRDDEGLPVPLAGTPGLPKLGLTQQMLDDALPWYRDSQGHPRCRSGVPGVVSGLLRDVPVLVRCRSHHRDPLYRDLTGLRWRLRFPHCKLTVATPQSTVTTTATTGSARGRIGFGRGWASGARIDHMDPRNVVRARGETVESRSGDGGEPVGSGWRTGVGPCPASLLVEAGPAGPRAGPAGGPVSGPREKGKEGGELERERSPPALDRNWPLAVPQPAPLPRGAEQGSTRPGRARAQERREKRRGYSGDGAVPRGVPGVVPGAGGGRPGPPAPAATQAAQRCADPGARPSWGTWQKQ